MRLLRWCLAAALVVLTGAGAATSAVDAAAPRPCGGNTATAGNGWLQEKVPGLSTIAILRVVTYAPDRLYASDGKATLLRSDDAGCSWADISPVPPAFAGLGALTEALRITAVSAPSSATESSYLYVGADVSATDRLPAPLPTQPYVYVAQTGGRPPIVRDSSNGLPRVGRIADLAAADLSPRTVYAVITGAGGASGLWASGDAGASWTGPLSTDTTLTHLRVDPTVSNHLYAVKPGVGIVMSADGGRTFTPVGHTTVDVHGFAAASGSGSLQLVQGRASSGVAELSLDAGRSWRELLTPQQTARSVAVSPVLPVVAAYDDRQLSIAKVGVRTTTLLPRTPGVGAPLADSVQMTAPTPTGLAVTGVSRNGSRLLRLVYDPRTGLFVPPTLTPIHLLPQAWVRHFPSSLTAATTRLRLAAGASRDVPYSLLLPRTPSPVDLMFLVDTTDSTQQTIDGVRQGLQTVVNEMRSTGLDVRFGLGDFKDYPNWSGGGGDDGDYPYKLRRAIGPADGTLALALSRLRAGGGGDSPESDLAALYYSTTGTGETFEHRVLVPPGQSAGYRAGSLRLAFLATDETFQGEPGTKYRGPTWRRTVQALVANGVHQIGLAVNSLAPSGKPQPGLYDSLHDERLMAVATGALAPRGGVDCDGNGTTDIAAGGPLVCTIDKPQDRRITLGTPAGPGVSVGSAPPPVHLAPLVVQLAETIPDLRTVRLRVTGAPAGVARAVTPTTAPTVNLRLDNNLGYVVRFTCPRSATGHTWPMQVAAEAAGRSLATTRTTVSCDPVARHVPLAAVPPAAVALAAGLAPGTPPNPPPNVNTNVNPNPAVNPNAGVAQQDEEQPQLALADADQGPADETTLAMSRRRPSDTDVAWMLGAASLMTAGAAVAVRSRWRTGDVRSKA